MKRSHTLSGPSSRFRDHALERRLAQRRSDSLFGTVLLGRIALPRPSRGERAEVLAWAVRRLSPDQRRVVELRGGEQLRFREIARRLGRNEVAVRKAYHCALMVLGRDASPWVA